MTIIAISGKSGSGATSVAKILAKRLGLECFSAGDVFRMLSKENLPDVVKTKEVWKNRGMDKKVHKKIDEIQRELARHDNIVIDAKLSVYNLKNLADFRVWLKASKNKRTERIAERDNIPLSLAASLIEDIDYIESGMWKKLYNLSAIDLEEMADVSIDTTELPIEEIVNKIIRMLPK